METKSVRWIDPEVCQRGETYASDRHLDPDDGMGLPGTPKGWIGHEHPAVSLP